MGKEKNLKKSDAASMASVKISDWNGRIRKKINKKGSSREFVGKLMEWIHQNLSSINHLQKY